MAKVINDYTLEIGWSGSKVTRGLILLEKRIDRVYKKQEKAYKASTVPRKVQHQADLARVNLLDKTEKKLIQLRHQQQKLNEGMQHRYDLTESSTSSLILGMNLRSARP